MRMVELDATHDPLARSFVANAGASECPLQNLPLGVFRRGSETHCRVASGDQVLDLRRAQEAGLLDEPRLVVPVLNLPLTQGQAGHLRAG